MGILVWILLGLIAGWVASIITASSHGLVEDLVLGVVGSFVGGFILNYFGQPGVSGLNLYSIVVAAIGATVLIVLGRLFHH